MDRLPVMVSPVFLTAPRAAHALAGVEAPVPPCVTSRGVVSLIGQPKLTVWSSPAAMPKPTAFPPFLMCMM